MDTLIRWQKIPGGVEVPLGFQATGIRAGIKYHDKYDLAIIYSEKDAQAAAVYTRNVVKAHPLLLSQAHLQDGKARVIAANSGNANACMGEAGDTAALRMAEETAKEWSLEAEDVVIASTGVIGQLLPVERVCAGIRQAAEILREWPWMTAREKREHSERAALAIMTTDLVKKEAAYQLPCQEGCVRLGIMAKGSGMIHPNMGTMLAFITTDAQIEQTVLQRLLGEAVEESFNMVTVDGDTSTNDMAVCLANGMSGVTLKDQELEGFGQMLKEACQEMAKAMARDGEGATKFLEVKVSGASSLAQARLIARSICGSSLVKTACYGEDANWGRILAAAGYSGAIFDPGRVSVSLNGLLVARDGQGVPFSEEEAKALLRRQDIVIGLELAEGEAEATAWGCDLTHKYVDINADYRT